MSFYMFCGICCGVISVWALVQLSVMGIFYSIEAVVLVHDVEPHSGEFTDYDDFIKQTTANYKKTALNCWIACGIYTLMLGASCYCIQKARSAEKADLLKRQDVELSCKPGSSSHPDEEEVFIYKGGKWRL